MPKKVKGSAKQDRKGIAVVQGIVASDLEWIFREQPTDDFGIDAQIEIVENEAATGRLIAAQIKSGPSYFQKADPDGWWFRLDRDDLEYGTAVDLVDSFCLGFSGRVSGLCVDYLELDRGEPSEPALSAPAVVGPLDPGHDFQA